MATLEAKTDKMLECSSDTMAELVEASGNHSPFNSCHEAYAVILEELDEFWEECRKKRQDRIPKEMRQELIQVAAMAWRTIIDLNL